MEKLPRKYYTIIIGTVVLSTGLTLSIYPNSYIMELVDLSTRPPIPQDLDKADYDFVFGWADIMFLIFLPYLVIFSGTIILIIGGIKLLRKPTVKSPQIEEQLEQKRPKWLRNLICISFVPIIFGIIVTTSYVFYLNKNTIDFFIIGESNSIDVIYLVGIFAWSAIAYQLIRGTWNVRTTVIGLLAFDVLLSVIYIIKGGWYHTGTIVINSVIIYYLFKQKVRQYFDSKKIERRTI